MRRGLALLLTATLALSMTACGGTMATISTNDPRIIGQLEALADKDPSAAKMIHRYHSGGEDWTAKKDCICVASE